MAKRGRRPILDTIKKTEILAIVGVGCSLTVAAKYVGCTVRTIRNTAERDPDFAQELSQKEYASEIGYMENIRKAGRNERYWRAAAWALERINPDKYGKRGPDVITVDQIVDLMAQFADIIVEEVPVAEYRKKILGRLEAISDALNEGAKERGRRR